MADTKIEWAEKSWNPVTGCSPCSDGCLNCYAKRMAQRLRGRYGYPADDPFRVTCHWDRLDEPLRWRKARRVFVCSMSDLFHDDVPSDFIFRVLFFAYQSYKRKHTFIFLTKRPARMFEEFENWRKNNALELLPKNWWIGVTVCTQPEADEKIPILLKIPAAVLWVSIEPMLGPVDVQPFLPWKFDSYPTKNRLSWVVIGGETGPGARPMHPEWVRSIRDQCQAAAVPFFFKSWGEWIHGSQEADDLLFPKVQKWDWAGTDKNSAIMARVGKRAAGRLLDGRLWEEAPE